MARDEAKVKFTADTSEFNNGIKTANSTLASLRAGLKLNEAEFKNTGDKAEYLKNKQNLLKAELQASQDKVNNMTQKLEKAKEIYGENSAEVAKYSTQLTNAKTEQQNLIGQLNSCEQELEELKSDTNSAEHEMEQLGDATKKAGDDAQSASSGWSVAKQMLANFATDALYKVKDALVDAGKEMINLGINFTASMSNVQALSGATASEMERLEATSKNLGRSTIYSASQVSDSFGYMALAGWTVDQSLSGIDGVLNLAAASGMELAKASDMLTDNLSAFGLEAEDSAHFADMMADAQRRSNTSAEQLGEAYGSCAASLGNAGQSAEDVTAVLMGMANVGDKGSAAGTKLKAVWDQIVAKMEDGAIQIGETNVAITDQEGNFRSIVDIMADVESATDGMADGQKSAALAAVFNRTSLAGVNEILAAGVGNIDEYAEKMRNCDGAAGDLAKTMNDNLQGDLAGFNSALEGFGLTIYDYFDGPVRRVVQLATGFINGVTDALTPQKTEVDQFIESIKAGNEEVQGLLEKSSSTMEGADIDVSKLEAYKNLLVELNSQEQLTEFQKYQLENAVSELSGSIPGLAAAFDSETKSLNLTNDEIIAMIDNQKNLVMQNAYVKASADAYEALAKAQLNQQMASSAMDAALEEQNIKFGTAYKSIEEFNQALNSSDIDEHTTAATLLFTSLGDAMTAYDDATKSVEEAGNAVAQTEEAIASLTAVEEENADATNEAKDSMDGFSQMTEEEMEAAAQATEKAIKAFEDLRDSVQKSMQDSVSFFQEFSGGTEVSADQILTNLQSQVQGLGNWASNMETLGQQIGNGMTQEMYDALLEMGPQSSALVSELVATMEGDADKFAEVVNTWMEAMQLSENSETLAAYSSAGKEIGASVAEGVKESQPDVEEAVSETMSSAAEGSDMTSGIESASEEAASAMTDTLGTGAETAASAVESAANNMESAYVAAVTAMAVATRTNVASILASLRTVPGAAKSMSSSMTNAAATTRSSMSSASSSVSSGVSSIRSSLSVRLEGPHIAVPHFSMSGSFNAKTNQVPSVSVSYYDKGGVFYQPTFFDTPFGGKVVAERRAEAVAPIEVLQNYVSAAVEHTISNSDVIDYDKLAKAVSKIGITMSIGDRQFARKVREAY